MRLRELRERKKIGLNAFAKQCNIEPSYLSALERDIKKNPSKEVMERIAEALGKTVQDVFYYKK